MWATRDMAETGGTTEHWQEVTSVMKELREIMKKKMQKSVKDHVFLNLLLMERLISNLLISEEGSVEDAASSVILTSSLTEQRGRGP